MDGATWTTTTVTTTSVDPVTALLLSGPMTVLFLVIGVLMLVSEWKLYAMAGKPGWAAIVPIYNVIVMLQIVSRPVWWILLLFVPFVNIVVGIIVLLDFAKAYGKSVGYGVLMLFFPVIMFPVLAFSKDTKYVGAASAQPAAGAPATPEQPQQ